ncbi:MAG: response regulator transcription factor [Hyphomicrobiaceae bacterium]
MGSDLLRFAADVETINSPDDVLDRLYEITSRDCRINVLGAGLLPLRPGDLSGTLLGKTVFIHKSVPAGWWDAWLEINRMHPGPGLMLSQLCLAPFTRSEMMQRLEPLGIDRWSIELASKYGMRDGLNCPVGGRWIVAFWSGHSLSRIFSEELRVILFMGASFAAIRLQKLIDKHPSRIGKGTAMTPREIAVMKLISLGNDVAETARLLDLGEETVRTHLKKAQTKLDARNRSHAVAQAMRLRLIV